MKLKDGSWRPTAAEIAQDSAAESVAFGARTTIDDAMGKLSFVRGRVFLDVPEELSALLHDIDALTDSLATLAADRLPALQGVWDQPSSSTCYGEGCSCGMPSWSWEPPREHP